MNRYIIPFYHRKAMQTRYVGRKAANLARLNKYGINVPPGFVISTKIYHELVKVQLKQFRKMDSNFNSGLITEIFYGNTEKKFLSRLEKIIKPELMRLGFPLAVRSSMVEEDSATLSFAGQLDTYLDIKTELELWQAIKSCYAGLLNERIKVYSKQFRKNRSRQKQHFFSLAILIQKMVNARAAGVAFSANPFTGQRCVLIEAVRGLGDKLVGGEIDPDSYLIDPETGEVELCRQIERQPILRKDQILRLSELTNEISVKFQNAQDIEWAWDGEAFFVLQSRPITAMGTKPIYSSGLVSDMIPGLIKPLVWSTNVLDMTTNVFGRIFRQIYGPNQLQFRNLVKRITSRVYINVAFLADIFEKVGLPVNFFESIIKDEKPIIKKSRISVRSTRTAIRLGFFVLRNSCPKRSINTFIRKHTDRLEEFRSQTWKTVHPDQLLSYLKKLRKMHLKTQWYMWIGAMNMTIRNKILKKFVKRLVPHANPVNLIRGLVGLKSLEPNYEMWKLAQRAQNLPYTIQKRIYSGNLSSLEAGEHNKNNGRAFLKEYQRFLDRFGYLSINGTDFSIAPWIENQKIILKSIKRFSSISSPINRHQVQRERDQAREQVMENLHGISRIFFSILLKSTIRYLALRERLSLFMSEDAYQMRRIYLAIAELLVERGDLECRDDIFYLYYRELLEVVRNGAQSATTKKLIRKRKREIREDAEVEPADIICEHHVPVKEIKHYTFLDGIVGSVGVVEGIARIVRNPDNIDHDLSPMDILVVPFIDVGWTPLFPYVGGIVTETGGQLSHSAIIAREYGLPAVLSVKNATYVIRNGQPIIVDGNKGRVYLKSHSNREGI